jgi:hypothetical protein
MTVRLLKRAPAQKKGTFHEAGTLITHKDEDWLIRLGIAEKVFEKADQPAAAEASTDEAPPIAATVDEPSAEDADEA